MTKINKEEIIKEYQKKTGDTGSTEVQCAILTGRIKHMSTHCAEFRKDHQSRRGLINLVTKRKKLLKYLKNTDQERYVNLMNKLNLKIKN